jgi:hypothetical protein
VSNRIFFSTTIRGLEFKGAMSADGPYVSCDARFSGVALGVCGLRKFMPDVYRGRPGRQGWWLVKYDNEARLDLTDFSDSEAGQLSDAFGIVLLPEYPMVAESVRQDYFFTSPAWEALRSWSQAHPRLARQNARNDSYLPGWYERSVASNV